MVANIFEWYEFCISAFLAVVLGKLFFAAHNEIIAIIWSFALFALSYFIRPLGSIYFGYIGDKYGSGISLKYSMCIMTIPTCLIGILPTYNSIGYLATFLLIIFKLIQGFAAGGELPVSAAYVYQIAHEKPNSNLLCSLVSVGSMSGVLLASFVVSLLYLLLPEVSIYNWGWRLPFILGFPLSFIIFYLRKDIYQKNFNKTQKERNIISSKNFIIIFIKAIIIVSFVQVTFYIIFVWMPTYLQYYMGISYKIARISNVVSLIALAFFTILFGFISRFVNYKKIVLFATIIITSLIYPLMLTLHNATFVQVFLIQILLALFLGAIEGSFFFILGKMFHSSIRNKSMAITFSIPNALFSGTAPLICSYFIKEFNFIGFPALYIIMWGILTILVLLFID